MTVILRDLDKAKRNYFVLILQLSFAIVTLVVVLFAIVPVSASEYSSRDVVLAAAAQFEIAYWSPSRGRAAAELLRKNAIAGNYDRLSQNALANRVTNDLKNILHDNHANLAYFQDNNPGSSQGGTELSGTALEEFHQRERRRGYGIERVVRLPGNIYYIDARSVADAPEASQTIDGALDLVTTATAVILDLRQGIGASPRGAARFVSHFVKPHTHLSDIIGRGDGTDAPVLESWYTDRVPGPQITAPLYILTSHQTFSGTEACAYDLKALHRATLIGATTRGGATKGYLRRIDAHFSVFVPTGRVRSAITGTNWEGVGVIPDRNVAPNRALAVAYELALDASIHNTLDSDERARVAALRKQLSQMSDVQLLAE
jgi:hypothetical protein